MGIYNLAHFFDWICTFSEIGKYQNIDHKNIFDYNESIYNNNKFPFCVFAVISIGALCFRFRRNNVKYHDLWFDSLDNQRPTIHLVDKNTAFSPQTAPQFFIFK